MADETVLKIVTVAEGGGPAAGAAGPVGGSAASGSSLATPPVGAAAAKAAEREAAKQQAIKDKEEAAATARAGALKSGVGSTVGQFSPAAGAAIAGPFAGGSMAGWIGIAAIAAAFDGLSKVIQNTTTRIRMLGDAAVFTLGANKPFERQIAETLTPPSNSPGDPNWKKSWMEGLPYFRDVARQGRERMAAPMEAWLKGRYALNEYFSNLGQFGGPLAGQEALGKAEKIGRDITEARGLGDKYEPFMEAERRLRAAEQMMSAMDRVAGIEWQTDELNKAREKLLAKAMPLLENMDKNLKAAFLALLKAQPNPIDELLDGLDIPDWSERAPRYDARIRDQAANRPMLNGF